MTPDSLRLVDLDSLAPGRADDLPDPVPPEYLAEDRLCLVVLVDDLPVAKFAAQVSEGEYLAFWLPSFREDVDEATRNACAIACIEAAMAKAAGMPGISYLETQPSDAMPDFAWWLGLLEGFGFQEAAAASLYYHRLEPDFIFPEQESPLTYLTIDQVAPKVVETLFGAVTADTLDRSESAKPQTPAVRLAALQHAVFLTFNPALWDIAWFDGIPIGYVFVSAQRPVPGEDMPDFLLEMGVAPSARGHGVGRTLIRRALHAAVARGSVGVLARIDVANEPSIRIHEQEGFLRTRGVYYVHRLALPAPVT